jgi:hypothetical protein
MTQPEPRTAAGRAFLRDYPILTGDATERILAIEAEASQLVPTHLLHFSNPLTPEDEQKIRALCRIDVERLLEILPAAMKATERMEPDPVHSLGPMHSTWRYDELAAAIAKAYEDEP